MQVATVRDNQPWIASVYFATDINLNLYWISRAGRRHSQDIAQNSKVGGAICLPHNYGQKVRGLQFEGTARQLTEKDAEQGFMIFRQRFWIVDEASGNANDASYCYQLQPSLYVLFDEINFPDNPRQELKI